jgi:hypothetical protein
MNGTGGVLEYTSAKNPQVQYEQFSFKADDSYQTFWTLSKHQSDHLWIPVVTLDNATQQ